MSVEVDILPIADSKRRDGAGPVCHFVPGALERKTPLLAREQIADQGVPDVVELINGYKRLFLGAQPTDDDDANYKVIVVVSPTCRVIVRKASLTTSYGSLQFRRMWKMESTYNTSFRPFQSLVPFLFARHGGISDWKFFLDNEYWLSLWARRSENPQSTLLLRNYAACRGARLIREWPRFERSHLAGVARLGG